MPRKQAPISIRKAPSPAATNAAAEAFLAGGRDAAPPPVAKVEPTPAPTMHIQRNGRGLLQTQGKGVQRRLTVYLEPDLVKKLRVLCATEDITMSSVVGEALTQYLAE